MLISLRPAVTVLRSSTSSYTAFRKCFGAVHIYYHCGQMVIAMRRRNEIDEHRPDVVVTMFAATRMLVVFQC